MNYLLHYAASLTKVQEQIGNIICIYQDVDFKKILAIAPIIE